MEHLTVEEIAHRIVVRYGMLMHPLLPGWVERVSQGDVLCVSDYFDVLDREQMIRKEAEQFVLHAAFSRALDTWQPSATPAHPLLVQTLDALLEDQCVRHVSTHLWVHGIAGHTVLELLRLYHDSVGDGDPSGQAVAEHIDQKPEGEGSAEREKDWRVLQKVAEGYDQSGQRLLAGLYYYCCARLALNDGAFAEAADLGLRAYHSGKRGAFHVYALVLFLLASESTLTGGADVRPSLNIARLAEDAENAAESTGDLGLLAQAQFIRGKLLAYTHGLAHALDKLKEALAHAKMANDRIGECIILADLGHLTVGQNVTAGLDLQYQAYALYRDVANANVTPATYAGLSRTICVIQGRIAVGEFDRGQYAAALHWFTTSVTGLRTLRMDNDLIPILNYFGQLYIALGQFEEAETVITESLTYIHDPQPNANRGCNLALLGKLYIEWGRPEAAEPPLVQGWAQTRQAWSAALAPLVRNQYAELMMQPEYAKHDYGMAEQLLHETVEETRTSGFHRSAIAAFTQLGQLALFDHRYDDALRYSTEAVTYLQRMGGTLPALRSEEVFYNHYAVLHAAQQDRAANTFLEQAYAVMMDKANSLHNTAHREGFLTNVRLNHAILSAYTALSQHESRASPDS